MKWKDKYLGEQSKSPSSTGHGSKVVKRGFLLVLRKPEGRRAGRRLYVRDNDSTRLFGEVICVFARYTSHEDSDTIIFNIAIFQLSFSQLYIYSLSIFFKKALFIFFNHFDLSIPFPLFLHLGSDEIASIIKRSGKH